jgi:molybdopterin-guanine dinucleotide biosynthesis adapter protein
MEQRVRTRILFLCPSNSARSLMAEALARATLRDERGRPLEIRSAGQTPGAPHPLALRVLEEVGLDTAELRSKGLDELPAEEPDLVIRLAAEDPTPGIGERWELSDPAALPPEASEEERLLAFRSTRDALHARLLALGRRLGLSRSLAPGPGARPVIAVVGWKNSGKTTLVERLVAELSARGLAIATVKATHHDIDPDAPGKDSWRHRKAGAVESLLIGPRRWVLTREGAQTVPEALARLGPADLVVVEGLRGEELPKIEVLAPGSDRPILARNDPRVLLVAAEQDPGGLAVPWRHRDDISGIADFIEEQHRALPRPG